MPRTDSTRKARVKPVKPYPEFPLSPAANGYWVKKINGKHYYFGKIDDPEAALKKFKAEYAFLKSGITPVDTVGAWTVQRLLNEYLTRQDKRRELGDIENCTFEAAERAAKLVVASIPKQKLVEALDPNDFDKLRAAIQKKYSPIAANAIITKIRGFFKYASDNRYIERPVFYGQSFKQIPKRIVRKHRNNKPRKVFTPEQVRLLVAGAAKSKCLKAIVLLGFNTGINNKDIQELRFEHLDLDGGWLDMPREKTGIQRRGKLMPETVKAINDYLSETRKPKEGFEQHVFLTAIGKSWGNSSLASEFSKLRKRINVESGKELIPHGSFGWFRHMLTTFGSTEKVVTDYVMGHAIEGIDSHYRELVPDSKLEAVAESMREYLHRGEGNLPL